MSFKDQPFDFLTLCLSGGGYRAAAFHLGSMAYLDHARYGGSSLLQQVKVLSSVAGGSLTGAMYTTTLWKKQPFSQCFNRLYSLMKNTDLVDEGLRRLGHEEWPAFKTRNLANAIAQVYHELFFDETFEIFWQNGNDHLDEIIFTTTESSGKEAFRFQKTLNDEGYFGSRRYQIPLSAAKEIRIADVVAASFCFPGGFEPMTFPHDFQHADATHLNQWMKNSPSGDINTYPVKIMDGGASENHGIGSAIQAERRVREGTNKNNAETEHINLLIFSDVATPDINTLEMNLTDHILSGKKTSPQRENSVLRRIRNMFSRRGNLFSGVLSGQQHERSYRTLMNSVFELREGQVSRSVPHKKALNLMDAIPEPGRHVERVSDIAASVGTALWFTPEELEGKENKLDSLIACGSFDMCFQLLKYIECLYQTAGDRNFNDKAREQVGELYRQVQQDWEDFRKDPFRIVEQLIENQNEQI